MKNLKFKNLFFALSLVGIMVLSCMFVSAEEPDISEEALGDEALVGIIHPDQLALNIHETSVSIQRGEGYQLSVTQYYLGGIIEWSSSNSHVTVTQSGYVRGVSQGSATITASIPVVPGGYINYDVCTVTVSGTPIFDDGMYVLDSWYFPEDPLFAYENSRTPTNTSSVPLNGTLDKEEYLWIFTLGSDGLYTIRSLYSMKLLCCNNGAISSGTLITHTSATNTPGCKWSIERNNGQYSFVPSASSDNSVRMGVSQSGTQYYLCLKTYSFTNSSETLWSLLRKLPTNGEELEYGSQLWASDTTSYQYVMNYFHRIGHPYDYSRNTHEGAMSDNPLPTEYENDADAIIEAVLDDIASLNSEYGIHLSFTEIGQYEECDEGQYKIALAVGERGHRWYKQDADGFWSFWDDSWHDTRDYDDNFDAIIDPQYALSNEYDTFIGYFAVTPWN